MRFGAIVGAFYVMAVPTGVSTHPGAGWLALPNLKCRTAHLSLPFILPTIPFSCSVSNLISQLSLSPYTCLPLVSPHRTGLC